MKHTMIITLLSSVLPVHLIYAAINIPDNPWLPGGNIDGIQGVAGVMTKIIEKGLDITAMMAVIGICISGYLFMTTGGSEEKYKKALKYSWVIAVGVLISASAFGIIALINKAPSIL